MPELPDVQVYRKRIDQALGRRVKQVLVEEPVILTASSVDEFSRNLERKRIEKTLRRGKHLLVGLTDETWIALHFGMTGSLQLLPSGDRLPAHTAVRFDFTNGTVLALICIRKFCRIQPTPDPESFFREKHLGPDAMDEVDAASFQKLMTTRRGNLKAAFMDQSLLSGIGNIYSDEILFQSRLHPQTEPAAMDRKSLKKIHEVMKRVLTKAIELEADVDRFPEDWLLPHRRKGDPCPVCDGDIVMKTIAGRSSYFCPSCQKLP